VFILPHLPFAIQPFSLISRVPLLLSHLILEDVVSKAVPRKSKSSARKVSLTSQMAVEDLAV
jgi:hypothetical protein